MKKWQKVTIWVASILIVLVVGGLFAANYAVDKVLNSMVGMSVDDLLEEDSSDVEENGDASATPTEEDVAAPEESDDQAAGNGTTDDQAGSDPQGTDGQTTDSSQNGSKEQATEKPAATKKPEATKEPADSKSNSGGYSAEVSTDKAKEVEENITVAEKAKVVTTLMGSLSASEIATLQKLASGGLSVEEKKEAKKIMLEKLSEDQYNELIEIAAKHGLSQGKKYSETTTE